MSRNVASAYMMSPAAPTPLPSPMSTSRVRYDSPVDVNSRSRMRNRQQPQQRQHNQQHIQQHQHQHQHHYQHQQDSNLQHLQFQQYHSQQLSQTAHLFSTSTSGSSHVNALKCPELLLRGVELQRKLQHMGAAHATHRPALLTRLEKKGKRFESPWSAYQVAVYAGVLFYYDDLNDLPRGIVPLAGCVVKAVDRIFKNSDQLSDMEASAENCGPCFKLTSSANRVLLFRCDSDATRMDWIRQIENASVVGDTTTNVSALTTTSSFSSTTSRASSGSDRLSLDDLTSVRPPSQSQRRSMTHAIQESAHEPEISQMLRDAMALVRKQKQEILELRKALDDEKRRSSALAIDGPVSVQKCTAPPPNEPIAQQQQHKQQSSSLPVPASAPEPASEVFAFQQQPAAAGTDYLQKQAMELAEIARNLQLSFRNDAFAASASTKQIYSGNSSSPTELMDHISSTSSNYSDQPSEREEDDEDDDDDDVESDAGSERLSEFEETDAKFLESSGILDSIHKVMRDLMLPTTATTPSSSSSSEPIIINDDIIAEIRQGVAAQDTTRQELRLMDPNTLRSLRSQSSCDEVSDFKLQNSPTQSMPRTRSAIEFSADDFNSPASNTRQRKRLPPDLGVLVMDDNMAVVSSILQTASREEKTLLLLPLVRLFNRHNKLSRLIKWAIESEVASVMNVATLFRSDDYASRLVSTYSKSVGGNFIKIILTDPIREIYKLQLTDIDLTPTLQEEEVDQAVVRRNADNLMHACQLILDSIIANKCKIPSSYFHICSHLNAKVINRFDGSLDGLALEDPASLTRSVIGGFLFLRFVCPAITTPHLHDLVDKEPQPETRKILVLITKLLFKTATSVLFTEKESHLRILNPFIERNSPAIQQLFVDLSIAPAASIDECFASDSENLFADTLPDQAIVDVAVIRAIAEKNFDEIEKKLSVSGCSPLTAENLRASLHAASGSRGDDAARISHKGPRSKKLNMKLFSSFSKIVRKQSDV